MSYKYRYQFTIEGINKQTGKPETLCIMRQNRNVGIDHELYKTIRKECFHLCKSYSSVYVTIVRWDLRYPEDSFEYINSRTYVGMFFFDLYKTYTHRSIALVGSDGVKSYWSTFSWKSTKEV